MNSFNKTRRDFIKNLGIAALGTSTLSSVLKLKSINSAFLNNLSSADDDYKALVCFFKTGGNDSFNMVIPRGNQEYLDYSTTRSNLSIAQDQLLNVQPITDDGKQYGLHPSFTDIQQLFNNKKLSFINNIGSMIVPTTKTEFRNKSVPLPLGLFSHADQIQQWQTASPHLRTPYGWGGSLANLMQSTNTNENVSMNISTSGTNVFQYGKNIVEYSISPFGGSEGIIGYDKDVQNGFDMRRTNAIDQMLDKSYTDIYKETYAKTLLSARDGGIEFQQALDGVQELSVEFSNNYISQSFKTIANTIQARETLGFKRQIFFIEYGGWDHHDNLILGQANKLTIVNNAFNEFAQALEEIGVFDNVTTFSISEFARTLTSNGNGSDHAWGGNVMLMGGSVKGGDFFGNYPSLELGNDLELGGGVLIPTIANDLYFAELALWFGVNPSDLNTIFPNIGNFYDIDSSTKPLGILNY